MSVGIRIAVTLVLATVPVAATAQQVIGTGAREATSAASTELVTTELPAAVPLAAKRRSARPISANQSYNRERAAAGRVGVRLGDDMSFRAEN
ncbi:hypothetical protein SAMN06297144_1122 [Sphingomonas guangdongensis]|uniref:Uncharacterized protein n=1 Tax=Sphingomonas guangdongensis TaxID=1141890 RepID=A0A285QF51_9SPHN|nr:hypothetical protein [Sphingomonas guangdongensis]SOB80560.1 hypothetical protein SAMN06297144_1122 [Sphingomonas guangdongensis]